MMINKIFSWAIILLSTFVIGCVNQNPNKQISTSPNSEEIDNPEKAEFTETFDKLGFSITTPCKLNDVTSQSSGNFIINYGGIEDENDDSRIAFYQVIVTKLTNENKQLPDKTHYDFIDKSIRKAISNFTNVEKVNFYNDQYIGYIGYSTHNGLNQKSLMFCKNEYIIALTIMTNYNLEERFDKFINSFNVLSQKRNVRDNVSNKSNEATSNLPQKYNHSKFAFNYPAEWNIVQENIKANPHATIAVQIMDQSVRDNEFAPNINIILSNNKYTESVVQLAKISYNQVKDAGLPCKLNRISDITIGGCNSGFVDYTVNIQNYKLRVLQYIVKKSDNSTITITITLDNNKYSKQKNIASEIIKSFKFK